MKTNLHRSLKKDISVLAMLLCADLLVSGAHAASVVAVGENGVITQTSDSGGNWFLRSSGTQVDLSAVDCIGVHCWATGDSGTILHSQDAGVSWSAQNSGTAENLNDVDFLDNDNGWAVGARGTVLETNNGGSTWLPLNLNSTLAFYSVSALDHDTLWVAGQLGTMRHTVDGGASWSFQTSGTNQSIQSVDFANATNGVFTAVFSATGRTENSGALWTTTDLGGGYNDIQLLDPNRGWLVGHNGKVAKTIDGGANWQFVNVGTNAGFFGVSMLDDQVGWIVGVVGFVYATADGGSTWTAQVSGTGNELAGVVAFEAIPEPTTCALALAAVIFFAAGRRRAH